jgi:hypothetical protein
MSHGINSYYRNTIGPSPATHSPASARPATSVRELAAARSAQQAAPAQADGLSEAETQMISRYFPASESVSLRVYGPGAGARTLNPATVGSRLDIQG